MKIRKMQLFKVLATGLILTLIILSSEETSSLATGSQEEPRIAHLEEIKPDEPMTLVFPTFLHTWGMQKAGPAHLRIFLSGRTRFDDPQDVAMTVLDAWDDPQSSTDDDEPTIYGINSGRGEIIYNTSMFSLGLYGSKGRGVGQLLDPHGIDADPAGNLVVADTGNDRIAVLFNNGRVLSHRRYLRMVGENDSLKTPYDVALVPGNGVWVSDSGNSRLVLFDLEGNSTNIFDLSGIVDNPGAIALSHPQQRWSYYRNHAIYLDSRAGDILVKLEAAVWFSGRVMNADGEPVPGAAVFPGILPEFPDYRNAIRTEADGVFVFPSEGQIPDLITVVHPDYALAFVDVVAERSDFADIEVLLDRGGTIEGAVSIGEEYQYHNLSLHFLDDERIPVQKTSTVGSEGRRYKFVHVPAGLVEIRLVSRGKYRKQAFVVSGETTIVDFDTSTGASSLAEW